jgi:flagellar motor switch protein FliM
MEQILSQEEVDALLKGVTEGEIVTETQKEMDDSGVIPYELTSQDRIIRGRMPTLEVIHHRFCQFFRTTLSAFVRRIVDVNAVSMEIIKFGDFMKTIPVPASFHIFRLKPLRGDAIVVLESKLIFSLIDCFFGGEGDISMKMEGREFTEIEQKIIEKVVKAALRDLEVSWRPLLSLDIQWERSEVNPQFITIVSPSEAVIVNSFEVEIERAKGIMSVCIPYSTIEPIRRELQTGFQGDRLEVDQAWMKRLKELLMGVTLNASVELGVTMMPLGELIHLSPGDIIQLDKNADEELIVKIENVPKFKGIPGILKGSKAIQISSVICLEEKEEENG